MIQFLQYMNQLFAIVNQETWHVVCVDCLENDLNTFFKENIRCVTKVAFEGFHLLIETVILETATLENVDEFWAEYICILGGFVNGFDKFLTFRRDSNQTLTSIHQVTRWYVNKNEFKPC